MPTKSKTKGIALVADEHFSGYKKGDVFTLESSPRQLAQKALAAYGPQGDIKPGMIHSFDPNDSHDVDNLQKHLPGTNVPGDVTELESFESVSNAPKVATPPAES